MSTSLLKVFACLALAVCWLSCDRSKDSAAPLVINEVMARNQSFLHAQYPALAADARVPLDWAEIYNPNDFAVALDGYSLTDDPGRPGRYRLPPNLALRGRETLLVSFFTGGDQRAIESQPARAREQLAAEEVELASLQAELARNPNSPVLQQQVIVAENGVREAQAFVDEAESFRFTELHADFGLSGSRDTLYLMARDEVLSEVGIFNLPEDVSIGRSPDGAESFGVLVHPTPGALNAPVGLAPRFPVGGEPHAELCVDEGERVPLTFTLLQDSASAPPEVRLLWSPTTCDASGIDNVVENCDLRFDASSPFFLEDVREAELLPAVQSSLCPQSDGRESAELDPECAAVFASTGGLRETRRLEYTAFLPAMPAGASIQWRLEIADDLGELTWCRCYEYRAACIDLVVSEYQPRNVATLPFVCETCIDSTRVRYPDWFEVRNVGESPIDLSRIGIAGRNAFRREVINSWSFTADTFDEDLTTRGDPKLAVLAPGECRLVLADGDGGTERRIYRRLIPDAAGNLVADASCRYYSASFNLNPARDGSPDEFSLVAHLDNGPVVLDRVILDFSDYARERGLDPVAENFLADHAAGRFPEVDHPEAIRIAERFPKGDLAPGTVTACPTPVACESAGFSCDNQLDCDRFATVFLPELAVSVVDAAQPWRRCPTSDEAVRIVSYVAIDERLGDTFDVELRWMSEAGAEGVLRRGDEGVTVELAAERRAEAPPGRVLWRLEFLVPPQAMGRVRFDIRVRESGGDLPWQIFDSTTSPGSVSFSYVSGEPPTVDAPQLLELSPWNESVRLPGFDAGDERGISDYVEIGLPATSGRASLDVSGWYLSASDDPDGALAQARQVELPAGTLLRRGEPFLLAAGEVADASQAVALPSLDLPDCRGVVYLIGPDELGNCIVDRLVWDCAGESGENRSYGSVCDAPGQVIQLPVPTPGEDNVLRPRLASVFHSDANVCGGISSNVNAILLIDEGALARAGWAGEPDVRPFLPTVLPSVSIDFDGGTPVPISFDFAVPSELEVPAGSVAVRAVRGLIFSGGDEPVGYSVRVEDGCGRTLSLCEADESCFAIGQVAPVSPPSISELNRNSVVPGGTEDASRRWIEIAHSGDTALDISGTSLSTREGLPRAVVLPEGSVLSPRGALLVLTDGGELLTGNDAPPHVVVDLDWLPDREVRDIEGGVRIVCGVDPEDPGPAPDAIRLFLFDRPERGFCLLDSIGGPDGREVLFPSESCDDPLSLLLDPASGEYVSADPTPGRTGDELPEGTFLRGDADGDGQLQLNDAIAILDFLFRQGAGQSCRDALDTDDSGRLSIADAVALLGFLFQGGEPPPPPFPEPGTDRTSDELPCPLGTAP